MIQLDFDRVFQQVEQGYINVQRHPTNGLQIFNYSKKTQFERLWTAETLACRGLIMGAHGEIVARPFPKFFSYEQLDGRVPAGPFEVYEKLDGSLGILYLDDGCPKIATRGSFVSQQAERASRILSEKYADVEFDPKLTYLFEIIYPENRIVVDYGQTEDLILLATIDTHTGIEQPLFEFGLPLVKRHEGFGDFNELLGLEHDGQEGFVVRFQGGQPVKVKFAEYQRLHWLMTGITAKDIWEALREGRGLREILEQVPDEFYQWIKNQEQELNESYRAIESKARQDLGSYASRAEAARYIEKCEYPAIMYAMLDGKDYSDIIWRRIRPSDKLPFNQRAIGNHLD